MGALSPSLFSYLQTLGFAVLNPIYGPTEDM